jgi:hypothetical protein
MDIQRVYFLYSVHIVSSINGIDTVQNLLYHG